MTKILKIPNIRFYQPGRCDTRCSPTPYRLTLFDRTPLNDDLWIIFFIMMASGAPLARFFCDTPHSAYTKAIVIHSVNKTHFLLFRKQLICVTQTNILQGVSKWTDKSNSCLTDRNMQVVSCLKVVLTSWFLDIWVSLTSFQKSNVGLCRLASTASDRKDTKY